MDSHARARRARTRRRRTWSDDRLVGACLEGDVDAWTELLDRYSGLIYSVGLQCGLNSDDAADLLQNVSMIMLDHLGSLRSAQSLSSWILTVTRREAVRGLRRSRRHAAAHDPANPKGDAMPNGELPDDLAARLVALQEQQLVREAMERLPSRCRQMLEMLFCEDPPASYAEVSARMGVPVGSVGPTRARCLARLRKTLTEMGF